MVHGSRSSQMQAIRTSQSQHFLNTTHCLSSGIYTRTSDNAHKWLACATCARAMIGATSRAPKPYRPALHPWWPPIASWSSQQQYTCCTGCTLDPSACMASTYARDTIISGNRRLYRVSAAGANSVFGWLHCISSVLAGSEWIRIVCFFFFFVMNPHTVHQAVCCLMRMLSPLSLTYIMWWQQYSNSVEEYLKAIEGDFYLYTSTRSSFYPGWKTDLVSVGFPVRAADPRLN